MAGESSSSNSSSSSSGSSSMDHRRRAKLKKAVLTEFKNDFIETELGLEKLKIEGDVYMFSKLVGKNVKVWSIFADTVGGVRGTWKGTMGIVTSFDDEFICLNDTIFLRRKLIFRIEII